MDEKPLTEEEAVLTRILHSMNVDALDPIISLDKIIKRCINGVATADRKMAELQNKMVYSEEKIQEYTEIISAIKNAVKKTSTELEYQRNKLRKGMLSSEAYAVFAEPKYKRLMNLGSELNQTIGFLVNEADVRKKLAIEMISCAHWDTKWSAITIGAQQLRDFSKIINQDERYCGNTEQE